MSKLTLKQKVFIGLGIYFLGAVLIVVATGWHKARLRSMA